MKCQILFSGKNKKNIINLSSAENAQRVVKVNKGLKMSLRIYPRGCTLPVLSILIRANTGYKFILLPYST